MVKAGLDWCAEVFFRSPEWHYFRYDGETLVMEASKRCSSSFILGKPVKGSKFNQKKRRNIGNQERSGASTRGN